MAHARFAPSSAQRVIDCPASLKLNETEPDRAGIDAAHGTSAHFIGELCLTNKVRVEHYAGCTVGVMLDGETYFVHERKPAPAEGEGWAFEVDDEMVANVQEYVDWCNDVPGDKYVECRVNISHWCPEDGQFGTSDHIAIAGRVMYVTDLKYGKGVKVYAENNPQAILYALGALFAYDTFEEVEEIHIRICQPRLDHKDVWIVSREELLRWGDYIRERFALALTDNPPFGPTEKACKFCKVAARCRALADHLSSHRALAFDDISQDFEVDVHMLTDEELVEAWKLSDLMNSRHAAIQKEMMRLMLNGHELPLVYLAEARTHRQFVSKHAAEMFLRLDCDVERAKLYDEKMISPAQAEKLVPKPLRKAFAELVYKPPGGPCIVEEGSKRPRYEATTPAILDDIFDSVENEE